LKTIYSRDLIPTQHHHNNCTTLPHIGVGPTHWTPPSCEGVLCNCCGGVVNLSISFILLRVMLDIIPLSPKLMWLLKSSLDQNTIMIYHKFNCDFKIHINFGGTKMRQMDDM